MRDTKVFILYLKHFDIFRKIQSFIFKTQHIGIIDFEFSICLIETGNQKKCLHNLYTYSLSSRRRAFYKLAWWFFLLLFYLRKYHTKKHVRRDFFHAMYLQAPALPFFWCSQDLDYYLLVKFLFLYMYKFFSFFLKIIRPFIF